MREFSVKPLQHSVGGNNGNYRETDWGKKCRKDLTWCSFALISCWRDRVVACFMENSAVTAIKRWLVSIMLVRTSFNWKNTHYILFSNMRGFFFSLNLCTFFIFDILYNLIFFFFFRSPLISRVNDPKNVSSPITFTLLWTVMQSVLFTAVY